MTELIWEGKYVDGKRQSPVRVALPFQTIETVNEGTADRQRTLELFSAGRETSWRNRLVWGDKKYVLPSLLPEFAGRVNLVYIDPPFDTGANFSFSAVVPPENGDDDDDGVTFTKQPSMLEQKAYRDTWGRGLDSYLHWISEALQTIRELLAEDGSLYVHLDYHVAHYVKPVLDELFGSERFLNEIIWRRAFAHNDPARCGMIHDNIFLYTKSSSYTWNKVLQKPSKDYIEQFFDQYDEVRKERYARLPLDAPKHGDGGNLVYEWKGMWPSKNRTWANVKKNMEEFERQGRIHYPKKGMPRLKRYESEYEGTVLQDLWLDVNKIHNQSPEQLHYPTQKPETLLERIIKSSSNEGDLVLDCFVGSGTTAAVAEKLNRKWIVCDLGRFSIHTTRKRLLSVSGVKPFAVQNLGKYERQAWQASEFGSTGEENLLQQQHQREAAYRRFILDLYHATPVTSYVWLHGIKSARMVHVGAVDAPVTLTDVKSIARETWKAASGGSAKKVAADILGWEFAFELNETARQVAAESRVDVSFKKIPREVLEKKAVEQGDIKFFELGALSVEPKQNKLELSLKLTDFVIPIDDVPEEARKSINHWSQIIDYWAVDWDFKDDTFHNQWQSYRTQKNSNLELSVKHEYPQPGAYKVVVKVIDILGNDTTKTLDIKVK
jgi:DNA modification methylase